MKTKIIFYILFAVLSTIFSISYLVKIETGLYYASSPIIRWKFAIYTGECDDETGCHYLKMKETGILEYFGIKKIPFIDKEKPITRNTLKSNNIE